jgi:hypothetical protein
MKTYLKLLQTMRTHIISQNNWYCEGLCSQASQIFDTVDYKKFRRYIANNKPKNWAMHSPWYFPLGETKPRLRWLNAHIKKLSAK